MKAQTRDTANGTDYKTVEGKLPLQDIDPIAIRTLGEVLQYGIDKYGMENRTSYKHGIKETYIGALMRHLLAYQEGEEIDPESGLSHLKHLFFNAYVLIYLDKIEKIGYNDINKLQEVTNDYPL